MGCIPCNSRTSFHIARNHILCTLRQRTIPYFLFMKEFELEPGEHVVRETRKPWFLFLSGLLPYAIFAALPFAIPNLLMLVPTFGGYASLFDFSTPLMRLSLGVWLLITWTGAWGAFTQYFLDIWVLTNTRLVDIDQKQYFSREVSSLLLSRVQDVTINVNGIIPSLLDIGDINVQSAGASVNEFTMKGIPRPSQMRDLILKYVPTEPQTPGI